MTASLAACLLVCVLPVQDKIKLELPKSAPPVFAIAKVSQDGKSVAVTQSSASGVQTYTVQVPVTRIVKDKDGNNKAVTEMRTETRQRRTTTRARLVQETYTVMVPVKKTITDEDGNVKEVTTMVPTTRTRVRSIGGAGSGKPKLHAIAECQFKDLAGQPVTGDEVAKRLKTRMPIVLLQPGQSLDQFYRTALNPKILLVRLPEPKPPGSDESADNGPAEAPQDKKNENDK
jgi:hypothetical protein